MISQKQMRFAREYVIDFNKTRAAKAAGYSAKTAEQRAKKLLSSPEVVDYIEKNGGTAETSGGQRVLKELERIAFTNAADFTRIVTSRDENGVRSQHVEYIDTDDLSSDARAAIVSIKDTKDGIRIDTADKFRALELLGKHYGLFSDKAETTMQLNISREDRELLERVERRYAQDN